MILDRFITTYSLWLRDVSVDLPHGVWVQPDCLAAFLPTPGLVVGQGLGGVEDQRGGPLLFRFQPVQGPELEDEGLAGGRRGGDDDVVAIFEFLEGVGLMQPERVPLGDSFGYGPGGSPGYGAGHVAQPFQVVRYAYSGQGGALNAPALFGKLGVGAGGGGASALEAFVRHSL